ncbi:hypothetical protein BDD43_5747 [Mucilaginibacter gracilis]|uniref:Uncharacterized protein n=1 Tax=Mucilaginibacter gracilis TaxID=423350 RepID=A0A495J8Y7_9SPHI|nr:hypothetical protein BDD43_5747 [Mucilaginibacter gracilis]
MRCKHWLIRFNYLCLINLRITIDDLKQVPLNSTTVMMHTFLKTHA